MIFDQLSEWPRYFSSAPWRLAFEYVLALKPDAADGRHALQGDDIYAMVMAHETGSAQQSVLEAHRTYIDIQTTLHGTERLDWFALAGLQVQTAYDAKSDAAFFVHPGVAGAQLLLHPGLFTVLYPADAHMPRLADGAPAAIKKVVVKVRAALVQ
ncbi:MAG: hypothetical protein RL334_239 [Chloroflexota bacterium]